MFNAKALKHLVLTAAIGGSLLLSVGCTKHPNDEQIRVMEETRQAALSAEQKLQDTQGTRQQKEGELSQAESNLQDCNNKSSATMERLKQFNN